jgi:hypothetical protein
MATTKYASPPVELTVEINPTTPRAGRVIVSAEDFFQIEFVAKREALERLSLQLSEQLTKAPLPPDRR